MLRVNAAIAVLFILTSACFGAIKNSPQIIPFGKTSQLIVDVNTGLFTLKYEGKVIVANVSAAFLSGHTRYQTADFKKRTIKIEDIKDKIGTGRLVSLISTTAGMPGMVQR